ncbi:MAG: holo-ACP synthase [Bacteroidota bacterium]|nr:holo-ACP synthase [Bacteroidota bacterium]
MIVGIGIDLEEVGRVEKAIERWGSRFLERMFTDEEIAYCCGKFHPAHHFAARFAAKEAFVKATGLGRNSGFRWRDVSVVNDAAGKPFFRLAGTHDNFQPPNRIHLSISHIHSHVVAVVVIERPEDNVESEP